MLDQSFSPKSLLRLISLTDIIKFKLGRNRDEYLSSLTEISNEISNPDYEVKSIERFQLGKKPAVKTTSPADYFALKKISDNLSRTYKIRLKTRDEISTQVRQLLKFTNSYSVIRGDIKRFYESINEQTVLAKIENDALISFKSTKILKKLLEDLPQGLPRGLSVSAVLSEIYIRSFDNYLERHPDVYFYSRYVDDFIVITTEDVKNLKSEIELYLKENLSLELNKKTKIFTIPQATDSEKANNIVTEKITFLGYDYKVSSSTQGKSRAIRITPSDAKIKKIKSRIIYCFLDLENPKRTRDSNIELFKKRLRLLAGNYRIRDVSEHHDSELKSGIYYTNKITNDPNVFNQLNRFLSSLINCRRNNSIGKIVNKNIDTKLREDLLTLNFKNGFMQRIEHKFTLDEISEIKDCWRRRV